MLICLQMFALKSDFPLLQHVNFHAENATSFKPPTQELFVAK